MMNQNKIVPCNTLVLHTTIEPVVMAVCRKVWGVLRNNRGQVSGNHGAVVKNLGAEDKYPGAVSHMKQKKDELSM